MLSGISVHRKPVLTANQPIQQQTQFGHLGHSHSQDDTTQGEPANVLAKSTKKPGSPWKLWLWGAADVSMMAGSVFVADMIVPDDHHHHHHHDHTPPAVQQPNPSQPDTLQTPAEAQQEAQEEKAAWWKHALELSGIATALHLASHVGLAGGWYLYGRSRGRQSQDENMKEFKTVEKQLKHLVQDGANFTLERTGNGEFKIKIKEPQAQPAAEPAKQDEPPKPLQD